MLFQVLFFDMCLFLKWFFSLHGRTGDILGFNFLSPFAFIYSILDFMCVCGHVVVGGEGLGGFEIQNLAMERKKL